MLVKKQKIQKTSPMRIALNEDMIKAFSTYGEITGDFAEGSISKAGDFTTTYTDKEIQDMLANPEDNIQEISDLLYYNYISNGAIYQLYTIYKSLPTLNYKIGAFDNSTKKYEESISMVNRMLHKVRYKEVTRDIIGQSALDGGVVTMWCGAKSNLFLYVFDNLEYVFPKYRLNGDWVCVIDLAMLQEMEEEERLNLFENLSPYVTEAMYKKFEGDSSNNETRYIPLPQERTTYIRSGDYLRRNQRVGIPLGTQALLDLNHKQQLKNMEKSVANKAIKNIAVLQIGSDKEGKSYVDIGATARRQIVTGVGKALKQNANTTENQVPVATIPEFCKLEFNKTDGLEALGNDKFKTIDQDLSADTGISDGISRGAGSNNAGTLVNLEFLYKRVGSVLEQVDLVFEKMIKLTLGKKEAENLFFEFDKVQPLSKETEIEMLYKLEAQGYSIKPIVDRISGINFDDFIEMSRYEIEELKLRDWILPPMSSYTMSNTQAQENESAKDEDSKQDKETSAPAEEVVEEGEDSGTK